jgi:hypothetical protein
MSVPSPALLGCRNRWRWAPVHIGADVASRLPILPHSRTTGASRSTGLKGYDVEPGHASVRGAAVDGQHATGHTNTAAEAASGGWQPTHCHVHWSADPPSRAAACCALRTWCWDGEPPASSMTTGAEGRHEDGRRLPGSEHRSWTAALRSLGSPRRRFA